MFQKVCDYRGEIQQLREDILFSLIHFFRSCNFDALHTPLLEEARYLLGKKYTEKDLLGVYAFREPDGDFVIRYEHTRPLVRFLLQNSNSLRFPFHRYQWGNVMRRESAQSEKSHEFIQFDADIVGLNDDVEDRRLLQLFLDAFHMFDDLELKLRFSHSCLFDHILEVAGVTREDAKRLRLELLQAPSIEMLSPILVRFVEDRVKDECGREIVRACFLKGHSVEAVPAVNEVLFQIKNELAELLVYLKGGTKILVEFDPFLVRGNGYYTGIVFEFHSIDYESIGALAGGGRYANLSSRMGGADITGVGGSFGIDRIASVIFAEKNRKYPNNSKL